MVDIHSHILNDMDDGSRDLEMSINMLKKAVKSGVTDIVATPHFMRGRFDVEYREIFKKVGEIKAIAKSNDIDINIYCGQEIFYSKNILEYYNDKIIGTINNTKYMLIELSMVEINLDEVINTLYELQIRGIVPIIAHPERYRPFVKKPSLINELAKEGMLFQVNAGSITGRFGKDVKKVANKYLENNIYSFIGSDAHRDNGRDTDIREALNLLERDQRESFIKNGIDLLKDKDVKFVGNFVRDRKLFGIF